MHDVGEPLEAHELRDAHRAVGADAADVVSAQIDEHHVLGALLLVAFELLGQAKILFRAAPARAGPRDRMRLDMRPLDADQHFRRRPDEGDATHSDEIHVRRRVDVPERAVNGERIGGDLGFEALREHHLIDLAGGDVLLRRAYLRFEPLAGVVRAHVERGRGLAAGDREIALELALEKLNFRAGELIQRLEVVVARDARVGDDEDSVLDVIESQYCLEQHEAGRVRAVSALPQVAEHRLEPRRGAIPQIAHRPTREARQIRHGRRPEIGHQAAERVEEWPVRFGQRAAALDRRAAAPGAQDQKRVLAEERIPADVLSALDAFEQECVVGILGDLQKRRDGSQQIGHQLLADRHERAAPGQFLELLKRRDVHRSHTPRDAAPRPPA